MAKSNLMHACQYCTRAFATEHELAGHEWSTHSIKKQGGRIDCDDPTKFGFAGRKDDSEKLARFDLLPVEALTALAELYGRGATKYSPRNWESGLLFHRVFRAMLGHAWAWWGGEEFDQTDGQHHLDSVAWNAFALRTYIARNMAHLDDRPKKG